MELADQRAIVIGSTSLMGKATARRLGSAGCEVALLGRSEAAGRESADEIGCRFYAVDFDRQENIDACFSRVFNDLGQVRIVVNLAGFAEFNHWTIDRNGNPYDLDRFAHTINVNLIAALHCTSLAAAHMAALAPLAQDERGVIVNTSSIAGFEPSPGEVAYACSKTGLIAMTRAAAADLEGTGIRCCAIAPGITWTRTMMPVKRRMNIMSKFIVPFPKRVVEPDEYARLVVQIIRNPSINGSCIRLDGALRKGRMKMGRPQMNA